MANASRTPYPSPLPTPSASTDKVVVTGFGAAKAITLTAAGNTVVMFVRVSGP